MCRLLLQKHRGQEGKRAGFLFNEKVKVENGKLFRFFIPSPKIRRGLG
jgi:hypothetical protein